MLKKIFLPNCNDVFNWSIDLNSFKEKYPDIIHEINDKINNIDFFETIELISEKNNISEITEKKELFSVITEDDISLTIYNTEIFNLFGVICVENSVIFSDNRFIYLILNLTSFQNGGLAIWDSTNRSWIFSYIDECFCVEAIKYSEKFDSFFGICIWNIPFSENGGEYFFKIDKARNYLNFEPHKCTDFESDPVLNSDFQALLNFPERGFHLSEEQSLILIKEKDVYFAFRI
jgi:hypothetical protein